MYLLVHISDTKQILTHLQHVNSTPQRTSRIANKSTGLSRAAITCGYKAPQRPGPASEVSVPTSSPANKIRLKGKARKETRAATKQEEKTPPTVTCTITTRDLIEQARIVAGRVEVPDSLQRVFERAIQARKRCTEWFQASKIDEQDSNEAHQHFISVLEQTLEILGKREGSGLERENPKGRGKENGGNEQADAAFQEFANRLQHFAVEQLPEIDESEIPEDNVTYGLVEDSEETRMSLMIFCFFEDMHRLQDFPHDIWKEYKTGELDLITASLITNSAVDIVRQSEEGILAAAPKFFSRKRSYNTIAIVIFYADALSKNQDPEARLNSNESPLQRRLMTSAIFPQRTLCWSSITWAPWHARLHTQCQRFHFGKPSIPFI